MVEVGVRAQDILLALWGQFLESRIAAIGLGPFEHPALQEEG